MRVIVTGAAGFIGSHLANRLAEKGHQVFGLDNYEEAGGFLIDRRVSMIWSDIRKADQLSRTFCQIAPDVVEHHAAKIDPRISLDDPISDAETNYQGTVNVIQACRRVCAKMVFASSCAVYGNIQRMDEDSPCRPEAPYGISKLAGEMAMRVLLVDTGGVALRYPNVYGPAQHVRTTGVIPIFAHRMARNLPVTIFGNGIATYQYLYIDDLLDLHERVLSTICDRTFDRFAVSNVQGIPCSVHDLVTHLKALFPEWDERIDIQPPRAGEQILVTMSGASAKQLFGWRPATSLADGLARMAEAAKEAFDRG